MTDIWQSLREMEFDPFVPEEDRIGPVISDAMREAMSAGRKGMKFSKEHRENMSKSQKGKTYTEEYKENMRRVKNNTAYRITYDDGRVELIKGLSAFARENNYDRSNLQYVKSGRQKHHKDVVKVEKLNTTQDQEAR